MRIVSRHRRLLTSLAGLALVLVSLNVVVARFAPDQIDLTRKRTYTLSPLTQNLLAHLSQKVEITLLVPREPKSAADHAFVRTAVMFREMVELYRDRQPSFAVRQLDPVSDAEARSLLHRFPDVTPPCVVIRVDGDGPSGHEVLHARDLAEIHRGRSDQPPVVEFFGEQALTAALVRLTAGRKQTIVYSLTGHGELSIDDDDPSSRRGLGVLVAQWRELDIEIRRLDLSTVPRVPIDADLVMVAGGDQPLAPEEIDALGRYWSHGGKGIILCDLNYDPRSGQVATTGLERLLSEFGVRLGNDRVVMQGVTGRMDAAAPALPSAGEHPLVRSLSAASVALYECRSIRQLIEVSRSPLRSVPLLVSHPAPLAWAEGDLDVVGGPEPGGTNDVPGPVAMAVAVERRQGDLDEPVLVVAGDAEFLDNRSLSAPSGRSASSFALASVNWLRGRKDLLGDISPRRNEGYRLTGTAEQQRGLVWKSTLLLSGLILSVGTTVWVSRRQG